MHGGHDAWSLDQAEDFLRQATGFAASLSLPVCFETHRRRLFWNPWQTMELLQRVPEVRLNADLSHWTCACERIFDETVSDAWWPACLAMVARHAMLIHARVGHSQGPQVAHPDDPCECCVVDDAWLVLG